MRVTSRHVETEGHKIEASFMKMMIQCASQAIKSHQFASLTSLIHAIEGWEHLSHLCCGCSQSNFCEARLAYGLWKSNYYEALRTLMIKRVNE
jgi:hypothetical protein